MYIYIVLFSNKYIFDHRYFRVFILIVSYHH